MTPDRNPRWQSPRRCVLLAMAAALVLYPFLCYLDRSCSLLMPVGMLLTALCDPLFEQYEWLGWANIVLEVLTCAALTTIAATFGIAFLEALSPGQPDERRAPPSRMIPMCWVLAGAVVIAAPALYIWRLVAGWPDNPSLIPSLVVLTGLGLLMTLLVFSVSQIQTPSRTLIAIAVAAVVGLFFSMARSLTGMGVRFEIVVGSRITWHLDVSPYSVWSFELFHWLNMLVSLLVVLPSVLFGLLTNLALKPDSNLVNRRSLWAWGIAACGLSVVIGVWSRSYDYSTFAGEASVALILLGSTLGLPFLVPRSPDR